MSVSSLLQDLGGSEDSVQGSEGSEGSEDLVDLAPGSVDLVGSEALIRGSVDLIRGSAESADSGDSADSAMGLVDLAMDVGQALAGSVGLDFVPLVGASKAVLGYRSHNWSLNRRPAFFLLT